MPQKINYKCQKKTNNKLHSWPCQLQSSAINAVNYIVKPCHPYYFPFLIPIIIYPGINPYSSASRNVYVTSRVISRPMHLQHVSARNLEQSSTFAQSPSLRNSNFLRYLATASRYLVLFSF